MFEIPEFLRQRLSQPAPPPPPPPARIRTQNDMLAGTAALVGSGGAAHTGVGMIQQGLADRRAPLNVGITYGAIPVFGAGHKAPAKAISSAIQELASEPDMPNFHFTEIPYESRRGLRFNDINQRYDVLADTGMGATLNHNFYKEVSPQHVNGEPLDVRRHLKVAPGGYVAYKTDIGHAGGGHGGFKHVADGLSRRLAGLVGIKDHYIDWGQDDVNKLDDVRSRYNVHKVDPLGNPAINAAATDATRNANQAGQRKYIQDLLDSNDITGRNRELLSDALANNKKIIAVTGSSRGDQVGIKLRDIARELRRRKLDSQFQLVGMLGDSARYTPLANAAANTKGIAAFGSSPSKLYSGLPAVADLHIGSSGTSALLESLGANAPLNITPDSAAWRNREMRKLLRDRDGRKLQFGADGSLVSKMDETVLSRFAKRLGFTDADLLNVRDLGGIDLDSWNKGNKAMAKKQPGVRSLQSAGEIVDSLVSTNDSAAAATRATQFMDGNAAAKAKMKNTLRDVIMSQAKNKRMFANMRLGVGGLTTAAAAPLLAYAASKYHGSPATTHVQ